MDLEKCEDVTMLSGDQDEEGNDVMEIDEMAQSYGEISSQM